MGEMSAPSAGDTQGGLASAGDSARHQQTRWLKAVTLLAVMFTLGNALWAAWDQGNTYDEAYHLEWPRRLLHERVDDRGTFRLDSKTPALLPSVILTDALQALGVQSGQVLRFASRLTPVGSLALCLALVAAIARSIDRAAAWPAVLLCALDPNLAANASIATSDVAYALAVLGLAWVMVGTGGRWWSGAAIGVAVGFAFAVKFTAVLLVPFALVWVWRDGRRLLGPTALRILLLSGAACLTASALYSFVGVGATLGSLEFHTPILQRLALLWPSLPLPFPRSILTGIDMSMDHDARAGWSCYLFGKAHPGGVWYYFAAYWLIKTPLALIVLVARGLSKAPSLRGNVTVRILAVLFGLHLIYLSLFFSTQIGLRFALLCIPLASILAACGLAALKRHRSGWLVLAALLSLAERAPYWGDPIAFTNLSVWPKSRAYWYAADSNLDYGQNRERLERYVRESGLAAVVDQKTLTPGLYVVGANDLTIVGRSGTNRWLFDHNVPALNLGFTHFGFSITSERFETYMNETRMTPSLQSFAEVCAGDLPHYPPGSQLPFERSDHPDAGRLFVVCVQSRKGADIGFRVEEGRLLFGRVTREGVCAADLLGANQTAWVRVPPQGTAQLCLREVPFKRSFLPYRVDGYLIVRGQGADVDLRPAPIERLRVGYETDAATPDAADTERR